MNEFDALDLLASAGIQGTKRTPTVKLSKLDWDTFFPENLDEDNWELPDDVIEEILTPPTTSTTVADNTIEDVLAWYQSMHIFGDHWGIFITEKGVKSIARAVAVKLMSRHSQNAKNNTYIAKAAIRIAFTMLFLHEQYHHKVEAMAIRAHALIGTPFFLTYFLGSYQTTQGTSAQIEEGIAEAATWIAIPNQT